MTPLRAIPILGTVQNYAWGRTADQSVITRLVARSESSLPYAELWLGAHPKSPATAFLDGYEIPLDHLLSRDATRILGTEVLQRFGVLPFLFKVLSIGSALSIQAHPDKSLASRLHARDPKNYPDSNHKPEVGIALSTVRLLYGLRSVADIALQLQSTPELQVVLGKELSARIISCNGVEEEMLRAAYTGFVRSEGQVRVLAVQQIRHRLESGGGGAGAHDQLFIELAASYAPDDIGVLSFYLMNLCSLEAGDGVFIPANVPHAYISGELVECMANSDNVVRAGLTTKYQDVDTLLSMISYRSYPPVTLRPVADDAAPHLFRYNLEVAEFALSEMRGAGSYTADTAGRPVLLFCLDGEVQVSVGGCDLTLTPGRAAIVPAGSGSFLVNSTQHSRTFLVTVPQ
jgi:mannose-6-phosphate isomerase